jgi:ankyrin repeat protein
MREYNGFTSLHIAAFQGNFEILELLVSKGGSLSVLNINGLTLMHTAAQGDNPLIMMYLQENNSDLLVKDKSNRSVLHWSCYFGSENAALFCIAWGLDLNA